MYLPLKSLDSVDYSVGSIIVDDESAIVAFGHNLAYFSSFRSDVHAETVTLNYFEEKNHKS